VTTVVDFSDHAREKVRRNLAVEQGHGLAVAVGFDPFRVVLAGGLLVFVAELERNVAPRNTSG